MNKRASSTGDGDRRVDFLARPSPVGAVTAPLSERRQAHARGGNL